MTAIEAESPAQRAVTLPQRTISLLILTYRRNYLLQRQLEALAPWHEHLAEVLIVDNANEPSTVALCQRYPWARLIRAPRNLGAAGRNLGFEAMRSDYIVTLDDDVVGLRREHLPVLRRLFEDSSIACINFRVVEEGTGRLVNWVHHRSARLFADQSFDTYEITEGAAAFRCSSLRASGGYPESFFLSHEGPDLAYRLMDRGWRVIYSPEVTVTHLFAPEGRASWRKYYYDTRNALWIAIRHLPFLYGARLVLRQNCAMLFYSARDGFLGTWLKAWMHALAGAPREWRARRVLSRDTVERLRAIDAHRPKLLQTVLAKMKAPAHRLGTVGTDAAAAEPARSGNADPPADEARRR
jgi:GT2 family glycosyltransferase